MSRDAREIIDCAAIFSIRDRDGAALASADDLTAADHEVLEFVTDGRSRRPSARNSEKTIRNSLSAILNGDGNSLRSSPPAAPKSGAAVLPKDGRAFDAKPSQAWQQTPSHSTVDQYIPSVTPGRVPIEEPVRRVPTKE